MPIIDRGRLLMNRLDSLKSDPRILPDYLGRIRGSDFRAANIFGKAYLRKYVVLKMIQGGIINEEET